MTHYKKKTVDELKYESEQMFFSQESQRMVVRPVFREAKIQGSTNYVIPEPSYGGRNLALVGILKKGESLEHFKKCWLKKRIKQVHDGKD